MIILTATVFLKFFLQVLLQTPWVIKPYKSKLNLSTDFLDARYSCDCLHRRHDITLAARPVPRDERDLHGFPAKC